MTDLQEKLGKLPSVDRVLRRLDASAGAEADRGGAVGAGDITHRTRTVRAEVEQLRRRIVAGEDVPAEELDLAAVAARVESRIARERRGTLRRVVNLTGVVLHTNLGRAPLSREVLDEVCARVEGYSNLEYDVEGHRRGSRSDHATGLLLGLLPAEAAFVVNNNAAAVLLALAAIAGGREVVVSRGELVEVGGGFRIPDVMAASGARLVEVGTTNRTRPRDYERAIGPNTALVFKAHRSNFRIEGFCEEVAWGRLASVAHARGLPLLADLGGGLCGEAGWAGDEPSAADVLRAGADLVCFSGDKLLGGPQAGILAGRADLIDRLKTHPLARAVRVGKFTIAAVEATIRRHIEGRTDALPALAALALTPDDVRARCRAIVRRVRRLPGGTAVDLRVVPTGSEAGGGSLPGRAFPSYAIDVSVPGRSPNDLEAALRWGEPPVLGRITEGRLLLDCRTLLPGEDAIVAAALAALGTR